MIWIQRVYITYVCIFIYIYICSEYLRIRFWRVWWWPSQVTLRPWTAATISLKLSESWLGVRPPCGIIWLSSFSSIAWVRFTIFIYYNIYIYIYVFVYLYIYRFLPKKWFHDCHVRRDHGMHQRWRTLHSPAKGERPIRCAGSRGDELIMEVKGDVIKKHWV